MSFTIRKSKGLADVAAFAQKILDVPGGVNIKVAELGGAVVEAGTPIAKGSDNLYHVCKTAVVAANVAADATTITVKKGHHFKVGDIVMAADNSKAYAITAISTNSGDSNLDDFTIGTAIGSMTAGDTLYQGLSAVASTSKLKYTAEALVGEAHVVEANSNMFASAVLAGTVYGNRIPSLGSLHKEGLKGIFVV